MSLPSDNIGLFVSVLESEPPSVPARVLWRVAPPALALTAQTKAVYLVVVDSLVVMPPPLASDSAVDELLLEDLVSERRILSVSRDLLPKVTQSHRRIDILQMALSMVEGGCFAFLGCAAAAADAEPAVAVEVKKTLVPVALADACDLAEKPLNKAARELADLLREAPPAPCWRSR